MKVSEKLGFEMEKAVYGAVDDIYEMYYEDVTAKDVRYWPKIVFEEMPEGLKGKAMRKRG